MIDKYPHVDLITDGSTALSNPGPGGWAAILVHDGTYRAASGCVNWATNNQMETAAVLYGLKMLTRPCKVCIYTDSMYVIHGLNAIARGRLLKTNIDYWLMLQKAIGQHLLAWEHVDGHTGNPLNEWADMLAGKAAEAQGATDGYFEDLPETVKKKLLRSKRTRETPAERISKLPVPYSKKKR